MATKETPPPPPAPAAPEPKKKRGKLLIIIGAAIVLVIGIATTAVLLLIPPPSDDEDIASDEKPKKKKKDEKALAPPTYLSLEPFIVNLTSEAGEQYLQAAMTLEFEEEKHADQAKTYMPKIRNQVMLLLSGKRPADLASKEGKESLAAEIRREINAVLVPEPEDGERAPKVPLKAVLFTSFIIQ